MGVFYKKTKFDSAGFTLMEVVVYTAILAALLLFVANTMLFSFNSLKEARLNRRASLSVETSLERITRETKMASSVDDASSTLGTNPSTLVLNTVLSAEDSTPASKSFFLSNGQLSLQENGGDIKLLSSPGIFVSSFVVYKIESANSQAVKIELVVDYYSRGVKTSRTFYASAVLRGR